MFFAARYYMKIRLKTAPSAMVEEPLTLEFGRDDGRLSSASCSRDDSRSRSDRASGASSQALSGCAHVPAFAIVDDASLQHSLHRTSAMPGPLSSLQAPSPPRTSAVTTSKVVEGEH